MVYFKHKQNISLKLQGRLAEQMHKSEINRNNWAGFILHPSYNSKCLKHLQFLTLIEL